MSVTYLIQVWDKDKRKYVDLWTSSDYSMAVTMMHKPYNRRHTRRLVRFEVEVIQKAKGER